MKARRFKVGRRLPVAGAAVLAGLLGPLSVAWACTGASASTSLSPASGVAGSTVVVTGANYAPGTVEVRWGGVTGPILGTTPGGNFTSTVKVPAEAPAGVYYLVAVQRDGAGGVESKVADTFEVTGGPAGASDAVPQGQSLWSGSSSGLGTDVPQSGGPSPFVIGGAALAVGMVGLFGGFTLLAISRRRVPVTSRRDES